MNKIYKTKWGQATDLEQIVTLYLDKENELHIIFKSQIQMDFQFKPLECDCDGNLVHIVNKERFRQRIETEVNDLIEAWKAYKQDDAPEYYVTQNKQGTFSYKKVTPGAFSETIRGIATEEIPTGNLVTFDPSNGHVSLYRPFEEDRENKSAKYPYEVRYKQSKVKDYRHYVADFVYGELEGENTGAINDLFINEKYYDIPLRIRMKFLVYVCNKIGIKFEFAIKHMSGCNSVTTKEDQRKIDELNSICYYDFRNSLFTNKS